MTWFRPFAPAAVCALAAVMAAFATGCGTSDEVAAEVAGVEYLVDDLHAFLATIDADNDAMAPRSAAADWLSRWVFFTALEQELAERGVAATDAHEAQAVATITQADASFVPGAAGSDIVIHQQALVAAVQEWTEREVPDPVAADPTGSESVRYLCSSHILVATPAEADEVLARLDSGESFGLLAIELSLDTGSGSLGGELGCVPEGSFVAPFEDAAYAAAPGDVVTAESDFGFHVIEVLSTGAPTAQNHPQLDAELLQQLARDAQSAGLQQGQVEVQELRQQLLAELQQEIFDQYGEQVFIDERYGRWSPVEFVVVPDPVG